MFLLVAYKLAKLGIEVMPRPICIWIGKRMADACFMFDGKARRAVIANLTHILSHAGEETETGEGRERIIRLARQTFENFAVHIIDFMRLANVQSDIRSGLIRFTHFERFHEALARERGLISVTAHLGNWEMGAALTAQQGVPLSSVALGQGDRRIDDFFTRLRASGGMHMIPSGHAARHFFQALKKNEMVAFVADRDVNGTGYPIAFFGREIRIPRGPAEIAARSGAPIVPAFCVQETDGRFMLHVEKPIAVDGDTPIQKKVDTINKCMVQVIEKYVARYPSQWFAFYQVWH